MKFQLDTFNRNAWSVMSMSHACRISGAALALLVSTTVLAASQIDSNIERVEDGLLPIAAEKTVVPANIRDRMRAYGVPGVSIAVVNDGKIAWAKGYGVAEHYWLPRYREHLVSSRVDQQADQYDGHVVADSEGTCESRLKCE